MTTSSSVPQGDPTQRNEKFFRRVFRLFSEKVSAHPWISLIISLALAFGTESVPAAIQNTATRLHLTAVVVINRLKFWLYKVAGGFFLFGTGFYVLGLFTQSWWLSFVGAVMTIAGSMVVFIVAAIGYELVALVTSSTPDEKKAARDKLRKALGKARQWAMLFAFLAIYWEPWSDPRYFVAFLLAMFILLNLSTSTQRGIEGKRTWATSVEWGMLGFVIVTFVLLLGRLGGYAAGIPRDQLVTERFAKAGFHQLSRLVYAVPMGLGNVADWMEGNQANRHRADMNKNGVVGEPADSALMIADINDDGEVTTKDLRAFSLYYPMKAMDIGDECDTTFDCAHEWTLTVLLGPHHQPIGDVDGNYEVNYADSAYLSAYLTGDGRPPVYQRSASAVPLLAVSTSLPDEEDLDDAFEDSSEGQTEGQYEYPSPGGTSSGGAYAATSPPSQRQYVPPVEVRIVEALPEASYQIDPARPDTTSLGYFRSGDVIVLRAIVRGPFGTSPIGNENGWHDSNQWPCDQMIFGEVFLAVPNSDFEKMYCRRRLQWTPTEGWIEGLQVFEASYHVVVDGPYGIGMYDKPGTYGDNQGFYRVTVERHRTES